MRLQDIAALPVSDLAHPDGARLLLWTTMPFLPHALKIIHEWGFKYSTSRVWVKTWPKHAHPPWDGQSFAHGSGYEVIGNPEPLIIAKIGHPPSIDPPRPRALIIAPRREHSRKPEEVRDEIRARFDGPRCELFARSPSPGFDVWGNDTNHFNEIEDKAKKESDLPLFSLANHLHSVV